MLRKADVQRISSVFQWCSKFSIFPFDWVGKGILEVRRSKYLRWFHRGVNLIILVQIAATGSQFLEIWSRDDYKGRSFEKLGIVVLVAVIRIGIILFQETVWEFRDELADLIFKTLHVEGLLEIYGLETQLFERKRKMDYLQLFLYALPGTSISSGCLSIFIDVTLGRSKGCWEFVLILLANALVFSRHVLNIFVVTLSLVPSINTLIFWLRKCISDTAAKEDFKLERSVRVYRSAFLYSKLFNIVFGYYFIPYGKLVATSVLLLTTYGVIRFRTTLNPFAYAVLLVIFMTAVVALLTSCSATSSFYNHARRFKKNLAMGISGVEDPDVRKVLSREWSACAPIRCQVGSFYYMEEKAKLTTMDTIIHGITFLLVSFK